MENAWWFQKASCARPGGLWYECALVTISNDNIISLYRRQAWIQGRWNEWIFTPPPFFLSPLLSFFSYPSNIDWFYYMYYKNSPPISKSWICTWGGCRHSKVVFRRVLSKLAKLKRKKVKKKLKRSKSKLQVPLFYGESCCELRKSLLRYGHPSTLVMCRRILICSWNITCFPSPSNQHFALMNQSRSPSDRSVLAFALSTESLTLVFNKCHTTCQLASSYVHDFTLSLNCY